MVIFGNPYRYVRKTPRPPTKSRGRGEKALIGKNGTKYGPAPTKVERGQADPSIAGVGHGGGANGSTAMLVLAKRGPARAPSQAGGTRPVLDKPGQALAVGIGPTAIQSACRFIETAMQIRQRGYGPLP